MDERQFIPLFGRLRIPFDCFCEVFLDTFSVVVEATEIKLRGSRAFLSGATEPHRSLWIVLVGSVTKLIAKTETILRIAAARFRALLQLSKNDIRLVNLGLPQDVLEKKVEFGSIVTMLSGFLVPLRRFLKTLLTVVAIFKSEAQFELGERVATFGCFLNKFGSIDFDHGWNCSNHSRE